MRPVVGAHQAIHITTRVVAAVGSLRQPPARRAIERALHTSLARSDFRIVHVGTRGTQVELIVEAHDRYALARGMQGFQVSAARYLNAAKARRGTVFPDRYRARVLGSRAAVRLALGRLRDARPWRPASPETPVLRGSVGRGSVRRS
ncbi:MAG: hypothetical protein M3680_18060 [Myxococcota bacterium]|nr:hypothetical protein [Myxococcota bacterium]